MIVKNSDMTSDFCASCFFMKQIDGEELANDHGLAACPTAFPADQHI